MDIFPEKAKFNILDISFEDYFQTIKKHLDGGTKTIELYGLGKNIPAVIGLAQTFVEQGAAVWEKLNTESVESNASS